MVASTLALASGAAYAHTVPGQYASLNRDMRFLLMPLVDGKCPIGIPRIGKRGAPGCSVSINASRLTARPAMTGKAMLRV